MKKGNPSVHRMHKQAYPKFYNNNELHSKEIEINSLQQKLHHWCQMCEIT